MTAGTLSPARTDGGSGARPRRRIAQPGLGANRIFRAHAGLVFLFLYVPIGLVVLLVACCNIISLLILLVNDKKKEIGILQAMGATKKSIALIFGLSGALIGLVDDLLEIRDLPRFSQGLSLPLRLGAVATLSGVAGWWS